MRTTIKQLLLGLVAFCALWGVPVAAQQDGREAAPPVERRAPVVLRPAEKAAVLADMRDYLKGLQDIFAALAKDDMASVSMISREMGLINVYETNLMFPTSSGVRFRDLSAAVHDDFEEIANAAEKMKKPKDRRPKEILGMLASTMKRCVSCHESFRLVDMGHNQ